MNFLWENVKFLHKMLLCSCNVDYWMVGEGHTMFANTRLSPSTKLLPPFINSDLLQVISASISDAIVVGVISFWIVSHRAKWTRPVMRTNKIYFVQPPAWQAYYRVTKRGGSPVRAFLTEFGPNFCLSFILDFSVYKKSVAGKLGKTKRAPSSSF